MGGPRGSVEERFPRHIELDEATGCWLWTGAKVRGRYGKINSHKGPAGRAVFVYAHRWSYEHHIGDIPEGLELDHLCRTPSCVNPWHLEPVPAVINMLRARLSVCRRGHDLTEENVYRPPSNPERKQCLACRRMRDKRRRQQPGRAA